MTTRAATKATKATGLTFPPTENPEKIKEMAVRIEDFELVTDFDEETETKHRLAHSKAFQLLNEKLSDVRDLTKAVKGHFVAEVSNESGIDRVNRMLDNMVNETPFVEADYLSLTGQEIEDVLPPANRLFFQKAITSYWSEWGVKELKTLCSKLEKELKDGCFSVTYPKAILVAAKDFNIAAWYSCYGILIDVVEFDSSMDGDNSNAGASILEQV